MICNLLKTCMFLDGLKHLPVETIATFKEVYCKKTPELCTYRPGSAARNPAPQTASSRPPAQ